MRLNVEQVFFPRIFSEFFFPLCSTFPPASHNNPPEDPLRRVRSPSHDPSRRSISDEVVAGRIRLGGKVLALWRHFNSMDCNFWR